MKKFNSIQKALQSGCEGEIYIKGYPYRITNGIAVDITIEKMATMIPVTPDSGTESANTRD